MNKKLAIRGHATRGKEVIEILEMMGGKNNCDSPADNLGLCYLIDDEFDICAHYFGYDDYEDGELNIFTLEEFLKKYPYKVGDKVFLYDNITEGRVTGMKWDEDKGTVKYCVYTSAECWCDVIELFKWNALDLVEKHYDEHCDDMYKTLFMNGPVMVSDKVDDKFEYKIPDGYEFDKIENGKIILKPIKPKYPTTYDDCCDMLNANEFVEYELMVNFPKLINARNAYWKIAGEEMGLDKPWEPDWNDLNRKYFISLTCDGIGLYDDFRNPQVLVFPTEEMRDIFYENFKDLIESCKELL